jgi:aspartyl protease family protein
MIFWLHRRGLRPIMGKLIVFAVALMTAGVLVARWADRSGPIGSSPKAMAAAPADPPASVSNSRTVILSPSNDGHFRTQARVDGRRLELVVDTGASQIALRAGDAARLGIFPTPRDYSVKVSTANGITRAALVQLGRVEIGDIVVRDVPALVHPDEALGVNLLGMSFLSRVRWTHERGKLILEQ